VHPQAAGQEADQRGEDRAIGPVQPGPGRGTAQHGNLVPQHQQLDVLGGRRAAEQDQPAAKPDEDQVEQAKGHGRSSCPTADRRHIDAAHRPGTLLAPRKSNTVSLTRRAYGSTRYAQSVTRSPQARPPEPSPSASPPPGQNPASPGCRACCPPAPPDPGRVPCQQRSACRHPPQAQDEIPVSAGSRSSSHRPGGHLAERAQHISVPPEALDATLRLGRLEPAAGVCRGRGIGCVRSLSGGGA
jgi:hypothetical protein